MFSHTTNSSILLRLFLEVAPPAVCVALEVLVRDFDVGPAWQNVTSTGTRQRDTRQGTTRAATACANGAGEARGASTSSADAFAAQRSDRG